MSRVAITEDESPILPKYVSKAMTPPSTLTNYFKVKERPAVTMATSSDATSEGGSEDDSSRKRKQREDSSGSNNDSMDTDSAPKDFAALSGKKPLQDSNSKADHSGTSIITPMKKKQKQASILNVFQKVSVKKVEKKVELMVCPICSKEFPQGTMNKDLNKHVDKCLTAE